MNQIEQIKDYKINPRGAISKFKNGGFIIYEENGHGFVASVCDLGFFNWSDALTVCDELIINGYNQYYHNQPQYFDMILKFDQVLPK